MNTVYITHFHNMLLHEDLFYTVCAIYTSSGFCVPLAGTVYVGKECVEGVEYQWYNTNLPTHTFHQVLQQQYNTNSSGRTLVTRMIQVKHVYSQSIKAIRTTTISSIYTRYSQTIPQVSISVVVVRYRIIFSCPANTLIMRKGVKLDPPMHVWWSLNRPKKKVERTDKLKEQRKFILNKVQSAPIGCASSEGSFITHPASPGGSFRPF
eukprot:sb/3470323/